MKAFFINLWVRLKNWEWWKAAWKRAGWTIAQTALGVIGTTALFTEVDWLLVLNTCALAGFVSILKSAVVGVPEVDEG